MAKKAIKNNDLLTSDDVEKLYSDYSSAYSEYNRRGFETISFVEDSDQWESGVQNGRSIKNKETLVFNQVKKYVNRIKSQNREIEFAINVIQKEDAIYVFDESGDGNKSVSNFNSFDKLVSHWFSEKNISEKLTQAFDKCIDFGYSVLEVSWDYENDETFNRIPSLIVYDDPTEAFFDCHATLKSKIDGNYCGRRRILDDKTIYSMYPDAEGIKKSNVMIDFWRREKENADFVLLSTGVYKRKDLLTDGELENEAIRDSLGKLVTKKGLKSCIYFYRFINKLCVEEKVPYPTEDLPLVYHSGLTYWHKKGLATAPYAWYLIDAQRFVNLTKSQIATNLKNSTGTKWFFSPSHVTNDKIKEAIKNINAYEGALSLGDEPQKVMIVPPTELPTSMLSLSQQANAEIDSIGGSMLEAQMSDNAVVSGLALKTITSNIQIANAGLISEQISFIDSVCRILVQMIPKIITEERVFFVKNENGKLDKIGVNIMTQTGLVKNDIKAIRNGFVFDVTAGATTDIEKENTIKSLMTAYQINPQIFNATADIFFRSLPIKEANELADRAMAFVDPLIVKLGNGEITPEEFQQIQAQNQMQMAQQMQGGMQETPSQQMLAQAEMQKAQADIQNAQTNAIRANQQAESQNIKNNLDAMKVYGQIGEKRNQERIDAVNAQLDATQKMIDIGRLDASSD